VTTSIDLFRLDGRVALVTGSSQGLGLAMARALGEAGARVVLNGRGEEKLAGAADLLRGEGLAAETAAFDATRRDAVEAAFDDIEARVGPIDILVSNAGITRRAPLHEVTEQDWHDVMRTNVDAVQWCGAAAARRMMPRGRGKIINICSLMSEVTRPTTGPYTASKGAVKMLTKSMALEWGPHGLQVNGIGPGYFATEMTAGLVASEEFSGWLRKRTPAGRWGRAEELAGPVVFLASDASSFVNGQVLYVDGGVLAAL
jgi:gluconate 5-dehydrogenase